MLNLGAVGPANTRLAARHGLSIVSTWAPWWFNADLSNQFQFSLPRQFLNERLTLQRAAAVGMRFCIDHFQRFPAPKKARAPIGVTVFSEASLDICRYTGIQAAVTGLDDIDIPAGHVHPCFRHV